MGLQSVIQEEKKKVMIVSTNWKTFIIVLQDIVIPIITGIMFMTTFVFDLIGEIEDPWVKIPVGFLVFCMAIFYLVRARKIWKEGTQINQQNKKGRQS